MLSMATRLRDGNEPRRELPGRSSNWKAGAAIAGGAAGDAPSDTQEDLRRIRTPPSPAISVGLGKCKERKRPSEGVGGIGDNATETSPLVPMPICYAVPEQDGN